MTASPSASASTASCRRDLIYGIFGQIQAMYDALMDGGAPIALPDAGGYDADCVREHKYTSALTLESAQVTSWIEFFRTSRERFPLRVATR